MAACSGALLMSAEVDSTPTSLTSRSSHATGLTSWGRLRSGALRLKATSPLAMRQGQSSLQVVAIAPAKPSGMVIKGIAEGGMDGVREQIHPRLDLKKRSMNEALWIHIHKKPAWADGTAAALSIKSGTSSASERGPREGVHKITSGTCGLVRTLCEAGQLKEAMHILNQEGILADSNTYVCLLRKCMKIKGLAAGKQVHAHIIQSGFKPNVFLNNTLVDMYVKCGSIVDACLVFDKMPERNMFSWTIMMAGYTKHGCGRNAFEMYEQMIGEGVMPDRVTLCCALQACTSLGTLEKGKEVHAYMIKFGIAPDTILDTALLDMYAKCGSIKDARKVFDTMAKPNVVSWTAMIAGYTEHGCGVEALETYEQMMQEGVKPNRVTFVCVCNACASTAALERGKEVHADIMKAGIVPDIIMHNTLVNMYAKCGSMEDAKEVFDMMADRDVVSWSVMITGYAQHGYGVEALETYEQMMRERVKPNQVTFICICNACGSLSALEKAKEVHTDIMSSGVVSTVILDNTLMDMYAKCGSMEDAMGVFDSMAERNVVSWSTMITGYAQHGCCREALQLFEEIQKAGLKPNSITLMGVLSACSRGGLLDEGRHYFDSLTQDHSLTPTVEHFGCMVDLLGRAGRLEEAEELISRMPMKPDAVVWKVLLGACRIHGNIEVAERAAGSFLNWAQH